VRRAGGFEPKLQNGKNTVKTQLYFVGIKCQLDETEFFYCRTYCLLNMIPAPLCPSSGARVPETC